MNTSYFSKIVLPSVADSSVVGTGVPTVSYVSDVRHEVQRALYVTNNFSATSFVSGEAQREEANVGAATVSLSRKTSTKIFCRIM
jgi:hypothetical protein